MRLKPLLTSVLCALLSLLVVFWAVPRLLIGWSDPAWIAMDLFAPICIAILLLKHICPTPPHYIWFGLPIQYGLLFFFRGTISQNLGISAVGLTGFEYMFQAVLWPLLVTMSQCAALLLLKPRAREPSSDQG